MNGNQLHNPSSQERKKIHKAWKELRYRLGSFDNMQFVRPLAEEGGIHQQKEMRREKIESVLKERNWYWGALGEKGRNAVFERIARLGPVVYSIERILKDKFGNVSVEGMVFHGSFLYNPDWLSSGDIDAAVILGASGPAGTIFYFSHDIAIEPLVLSMQGRSVVSLDLMVIGAGLFSDYSHLSHRFAYVAKMRRLVTQRTLFLLGCMDLYGAGIPVLGMDFLSARPPAKNFLIATCQRIAQAIGFWQKNDRIKAVKFLFDAGCIIRASGFNETFEEAPYWKEMHNLAEGKIPEEELRNAWLTLLSNTQKQTLIAAQELRRRS